MNVSCSSRLKLLHLGRENGRIVTLAIDGDGNPVILEYNLKKSKHALS